MYRFIRTIFRSWRKQNSNYDPLIKVEVSKDNLLHNYAQFKARHSDQRIAPVLKSNAYGHGLVEVARIFDAHPDLPFFVVDSYFEARTLRDENINSPILVIGYTRDENISNNRLDGVAYTIHSIDQLSHLIKSISQPIFIHLKIDTGMHRHGIEPNELAQTLDLIKQNTNIILQGVMTHLGDADGETINHTLKQIETWNTLVGEVKRSIPSVRFFHIAQTAGSYETAKAEANVIRLGIGLYGYTTNPRDTITLKPALELHTVVSSIKELKQGESIGYNNTFTAPSNMTVATIPVGYFEGLDRRLSNKGRIRINNVECPIIGRISMNITSIDVSKVKNITRNDPVIVISKTLNNANSILMMANLSHTIPYEILIHIPAHLRRQII